MALRASFTDVLAEELLQKTAAELATALNDSLPPPNECQHEFSAGFEAKMQSLIRGICAKCYTITIRDSAIRKLVKQQFGFVPNRRSIVPTFVVCRMSVDIVPMISYNLFNENTISEARKCFTHIQKKRCAPFAGRV